MKFVPLCFKLLVCGKKEQNYLLPISTTGTGHLHSSILVLFPTTTTTERMDYVVQSLCIRYNTKNFNLEHMFIQSSSI